MTTRRGSVILAEWSQVALPTLAFIALFIGWQWSTTALHIRAWILPVWSALLRRTLYPILLALQSIPKVALAPLITLWVGFGL
jgi:ABC-type nitrate/sulfonate/bicarbonate transport system permease component